MSAQEPSKSYVLRIYNANQADETGLIARRLAEALQAIAGERCSIEVVDVLSEPERAVEDHIFVTPTLVQQLPEPMSRIIGDLSDPQKVLLLLGIAAKAHD